MWLAVEIRTSTKFACSRTSQRRCLTLRQTPSLEKRIGSAEVQVDDSRFESLDPRRCQPPGGKPPFVSRSKCVAHRRGSRSKSPDQRTFIQAAFIAVSILHHADGRSADEGFVPAPFCGILTPVLHHSGQLRALLYVCWMLNVPATC